MSAELEPRRLAATILLEQPTEIPTDGLPFARRFISVCRFTYAKSVPNSPHEYCLRKWLPPDVQRDYDRFVQLIGEHGYRGRFLATVYRYLNVDGWRYWQSPEAYGVGVIINRANNERAPMRPLEVAAP
jgi:hypothetical protein